MSNERISDDASCQNGNCGRKWVVRINGNNRNLFLCGNCGDYLLVIRDQDPSGKKVENFTAQCHRN